MRRDEARLHDINEIDVIQYRFLFTVVQVCECYDSAVNGISYSSYVLMAV